MKNLIVTGGLGFIGSNLIKYLLELGYKVINLDKVTYASNFYNIKEFKNNKLYKFIKADISNKKKLSQIIKRYEMNQQKLQQISAKLGANIDFSEMENLLLLAKQNNQRGDSDKTKQTIDQIALKGLKIYKNLQLISEQNKIIRAQALAEKYVDKINTLIVQAKNSGLLDHAKQLEETKIYLISANSTQQITKNIRIVITINNDIKEIHRDNLQQIDVDEIKLSQTQRITAALNQFETKAKLLYSEAAGSNKALYYVEKALSIIDNVRNNLDNPEGKMDTKLKQIERLLEAAEKIVQEST